MYSTHWAPWDQRLCPSIRLIADEIEMRNQEVKISTRHMGRQPQSLGWLTFEGPGPDCWTQDVSQVLLGVCHPQRCPHIHGRLAGPQPAAGPQWGGGRRTSRHPGATRRYCEHWHVENRVLGLYRMLDFPKLQTTAQTQQGMLVLSKFWLNLCYSVVIFES